MGLSELSGKTQRTLTNTDIMPVQGDVGGTWTNFKTTLTKLREFIFSNFLATANIFTAKQKMSAGIDMDSQKIENLAAGAASGDALRHGQIEIATGKLYYFNGTTLVEASHLSYDSTGKSLSVAGSNREDSLICSDGFIRISTTYTPTSTSDSNGNAGSMTWDDSYVYIKTSAGWKRASLSTF